MNSAGALAELEQTKKQREIDLASRDVSRTLLSQLDRERLTAKVDLLKHRQRNLEIRSPIDGVVLSGTLDRAVGASVEIGKTFSKSGRSNR